MRGFLIIPALALFTGCVSNPVVDCSPLYDPDARKIPGKVEAKKIANPDIEIANGKWDGTVPDDIKNHKVVDSPSELSTVFPAEGFGALAGYYLLNALGPKPKCGKEEVENKPTIYEYDVAAEDGKKYRVWSYFPGFDMGQCVNIFISDKEGQFTPRLASGYSCKN